ncbi:hypothetical protein B9479_006496 [Cryptococcus floricola]|uniref:Uncharacterized protein n=1 Tax=Cryptococcus floricola TaxID=2591691 RepID=A0A5D3AQI2_9TREE|nr:hypothetical protein B9479_006496 [Cryptococcus floricola]
MIRSNPTAIPLRASDLKILQVEIDKRKAEREEQEAAANPQRTREGEREEGERRENGKSRQQERRERHERIGLS